MSKEIHTTVGKVDDVLNDELPKKAEIIEVTTIVVYKHEDEVDTLRVVEKPVHAYAETMNVIDERNKELDKQNKKDEKAAEEALANQPADEDTETDTSDKTDKSLNDAFNVQ